MRDAAADREALVPPLVEGSADGDCDGVNDPIDAEGVLEEDDAAEAEESEDV